MVTVLEKHLEHLEMRRKKKHHHWRWGVATKKKKKKQTKPDGPWAGRTLAGRGRARVNLAGPVASVPAWAGALVRRDSETSSLQLAWLWLCLTLPVPACPLLPRPQQASCLPKSGLCPIFSLIELMLLSAPRTHGIAPFGSGLDFNRRGRRKENCQRGHFLQLRVPPRFLRLLSDSLKGSEEDFWIQIFYVLNHRT